MTLKESLLQYEQFIRKVNKDLELTVQVEYCVPNVPFQNQMSKILENIVQVYSEPSYINLIEKMEDTLSTFRTNAITSSQNALNNLFNQLSSNVMQAQLNSIALSHELSERLSSIVTAAGCYMPEDLRAELVEVAPNVSPKRETFLTFDRAIALLGLLISLYTLIITLMPNDQLTALSEQNNQIIAIEEERLELARQQTEHLKNIANNLSDVIISLNEQIETQEQQLDVLGDQAEDIDDFVEPPKQYPNTDGQD